MKRFFCSLLFLSCLLPAPAQYSREEYIQRYQELAIREMNRSGIPASITMAQACLESSNGNSLLSKKSNNHFGIKCKSSWRGKKVYYDDDEKDECFRKYKTVEDSYIDHSDFLMDNPRYSFLFQFDPTDYRAWARGLKKAGYATARNYSSRLIEIIETNKLYRLDYRMSFQELAEYEQEKMGSKEISASLTISAFKPHQIVKRNRVKSVVARRGDTYETIAQELGLKDWVLYKYNNRPIGYRPRANEVVYIQPKKRRTKKEILIHKVSPGETMHYISQLYGIKLNLLCWRNKIKKGYQPLPGQIIYLRKWGKAG